MSAPARSVFAFGCYLAVLGLTLLLAPNLLLSAVGMATTQEVWIRVVGMLALALATYYVAAARAELMPFIRLTVPIRALVILFFGAFVVFQWAPRTLLLFGVIDLASATWTWAVLRSSHA